MSLETVDVILTFAIDLEASVAAFYETAITITQNQNLKSLFEALIIHGQSQIQALMHLSQQLSLDQKKVIVTGLNGQLYRTLTECPLSCPDNQLIQLASRMEQQVHRFYIDSRNKLSFLEDVPNVFGHLADSHLQNQKKLHAII